MCFEKYQRGAIKAKVLALVHSTFSNQVLLVKSLDARALVYKQLVDGTKLEDCQQERFYETSLVGNAIL